MAAAGVVVAIVVVVLIAHRGAIARVPQQERDFLRAVRHGQEAVRKGNDLTLVTAARDRSSAVCRVASATNGGVENWVGTISNIDTVMGGKQGHVAVEIGDDVTAEAPGAASRRTPRTTRWSTRTPTSTAPWPDLKSGDKVRFNGAFVPHGATCLHETSLFARNGMLTPGFVFRFTVGRTSLTVRPPECRRRPIVLSVVTSAAPIDHPGLLQSVLAGVDAQADQLIEVRRDLHAHPELSWAEERTTSVVAKRLDQVGLVPTPLPRNGLMVDIVGGPGPMIALRADLDALPVDDRTGDPWASTVPGVAHACGHDLHVASLPGGRTRGGRDR